MASTLKQSFMRLLSELKNFPPAAKKRILASLGRNKVSIEASRKGINQIYQFIALIFTKNRKMRIPANKEKLLHYSGQLEMELEQAMEKEKEKIKELIRRNISKH